MTSVLDASPAVVAPDDVGTAGMGYHCRACFGRGTSAAARREESSRSALPCMREGEIKTKTAEVKGETEIDQYLRSCR